MEASSRNWQKALPAVEPGVIHSNTALTFTLLLCSSGHNSLTHSPWLSFVFRCPSCPLLHTPKHDSFYLSLPCSFFISPFCLNLFQDKVLSLIWVFPHISTWQQDFISVCLPDTCWLCTCYIVSGVPTTFICAWESPKLSFCEYKINKSVLWLQTSDGWDNNNDSTLASHSCKQETWMPTVTSVSPRTFQINTFILIKA